MKEEQHNVNRNRRLQKALDRILCFTPRERCGIGMQKEKTTHIVLKNYMDPDEEHHEIPLDNYIADIYHSGKVTEIQTAGFGTMRNKLACFLQKGYTVTIVHPIPHIKWVVWVDPEDGHIIKKNRSPRKGCFLNAFRELYRIRDFLREPNLKIRLILLDMEEYRLQDGWSRDGKRGSHRYDRIPLAVHDELLLEKPEDYAAFLPTELPDTFTAQQFAKAAGYRRKDISVILLMLYEMKVVDRIGKQGRAYLYTRQIVPDSI